MPASLLAPTFAEIARLDLASGHDGEARKHGGITYTPPAIARAMVAMAAPDEHETIQEPACGRGVFIFALVEWWLEQGRDLAWIDRWAQARLACGDTDAAAIADLQRLWQAFFASQGHTAAPLHAVVEDGLFGPQAQARCGLILGNPPYVRVQHMAPEVRARVRTRYPCCAKGNVDLYYAFFEDALRRARRVCYIMPSSWLANASARPLRRLARTRLARLVDFGERLVFAPVRAYTAIALCDDGAGADILASERLPEEGGIWRRVARGDARWSEERFCPLAPADTAGGETLGEVAEVISGIATLADKAFLLPAPERFVRGGERWVRQADPLAGGEAVEVPERFTRRLLKATRLPERLDAEGPRLLYPYDAARKIVAEAVLEREAPGLLAWLERRRAALDGRDKGKTGGYEAWYAYGRRQGFWEAGEDETVLLVAQVGHAGRLPVRQVATRAVGAFLFTSGFVVRPNPGTAVDRLALALAAPAAWTLVQREGRVWAGAGEYRTFGARTLRRIPVA